MKFTGVPGVRHGFSVDLRETIEDVHLNAYAKLGIFYVGQNLVIELSDFDEEGQEDSMHEGEDEEDENEELPMPPLELSNEELSLL
jgi:hypothetical protein